MSKGNVIMFVRPITTTAMLRLLGIGPTGHLPRHSNRDHPRGDEPGRMASGAICNGIRYPHPSEDGDGGSACVEDS